MATAAWLVILAASVVTQVTGAPVAQLRLLPGGNTSCLWRVLITFGEGDGTDHDLCAQQLAVSFIDSPNAIASTAKESADRSSEKPHFGFETTPTIKIQSAPEEARPKVPPGYERLSSGNFYKLHAEPLYWHDARAACEREGAHLVVVETAAEADALRKNWTWARSDFYDFTLHAGFHSKFSTVLGTSMSYERWKSSQPDSHICGRINLDAWLSYGSCTTKESYVCEYEAMAISDFHHIPPVSRSPVISSGINSYQTKGLGEKGYTHLPGWNGTLIKNYGVYIAKNWEEANETCHNDGAFLVIVESADMAEALIDYVNAEDISSLYIGVKTGDPITVLGGELALTKYQRWGSTSKETVCLYADNKLFYGTIPCDEYNRKSVLCLSNVE